MHLEKYRVLSLMKGWKDGQRTWTRYAFNVALNYWGRRKITANFSLFLTVASATSRLERAKVAFSATFHFRQQHRMRLLVSQRHLS
jgi:hypothetical protein